MQDLPPQGSIADIFLPRLIAGLHLREFEGSLRLTLPDSIKVIYFKKGEIASAASNAESDRLANILIQEGRLTAEQLELARTRMTPGSSLGKTLIELGFLTPTELLQGARRQVRVIVATCFTATAGSYEMVAGPLPAEVTSLGLGTRRLLFDCLMQSGDRAAIVREIGSMEAVYRPTGQLEFVLASLRLDSEHDRIARLLNGAVSLHDLSSRTSHDDFTVGRMVLALDLLGAAERQQPSTDAAPVAPRSRAIPIVLEPVEEVPAEAAVVSAPDERIEIEAEALEPGPAVSVVVDGEEPSPVPAAGQEETTSVSAPPIAAQPDDAPTVQVAADVPSITAEPPAIPQDELPAFTRPPDEAPAETMPPAPADGEPRWEVDPETGERVHVGPIEMTFDGRIAPGPGGSRNLTRFLLGAGAVTLVVGGALGYVVLRHGDGEPVAASRTVPSQPAAALPIEAEAVPKAEAIPPEPRPSPSPAGAPAIAEGSAPGPGSEMPASAPHAKPAAARPAPAAAPAVPAPVVEPATGPALARKAESSGRPSLLSDSAFVSALQQLDQGDAAGAARQFESWLLAGSPDRVTLQVMIACQEDTVKGARTRAGADGSLFILPYSLKGRACYRICWGVYPDGEAARAALTAVPPALTGSTAPIVVPLSRLRSPG